MSMDRQPSIEEEPAAGDEDEDEDEEECDWSALFKSVLNYQINHEWIQVDPSKW